MFIFSVLNFPVADDQTLGNSAPNEWEVSDWLGEVAVGARGALAPVPSAFGHSLEINNFTHYGKPICVWIAFIPSKTPLSLLFPKDFNLPFDLAPGQTNHPLHLTLDYKKVRTIKMPCLALCDIYKAEDINYPYQLEFMPTRKNVLEQVPDQIIQKLVQTQRIGLFDSAKQEANPKLNISEALDVYEYKFVFYERLYEKACTKENSSILNSDILSFIESIHKKLTTNRTQLVNTPPDLLTIEFLMKLCISTDVWARGAALGIIAYIKKQSERTLLKEIYNSLDDLPQPKLLPRP